VLLALDTATPAVSVAVADGGQVLAERTTVDARRHGELLAPAIEAVLREAGAGRADVDRVAVGVGPGPFTGLRVGLVTARVLGAVLGVPVVGVCTLDVLALMAAEDGVTGDFRVVSDALRKEVHWADYRTGDALADLRRVDGPHV
jgi:tRNA threonylcarbamoyl adenosine modification protein YeaZ